MRRYIRLFIPLLIVTFASSLFLIVEKVLLGSISIVEMEVAVLVAFISQIFQVSFVSLTMMAQVNVAHWTGAKKWNAIGPGIWQFIWFSLLSILIALPVGLVYGGYVLEQAGLKVIGFPYLSIILSTSFLYPLGTALTCFYLGQGKTRLVVFSSIAIQAVKIVLGYVLILGWGVIPSMGLLGAALSSLVAQGAFCIMLFAFFIHSKNNKTFDTRNWKFRPKLFWLFIKPGLLRAVNRILCLTAWMSITQLVSGKGGDFLVILSIGGAIILFIPFYADAIFQTQNIIVSQILGSKKNERLDQALKNGLFFSIFCSLLLWVPFVGYANETCSLIFPSIELEPKVISRVFFGIWVSIFFYSFGSVFVGYIVAFKDMLFSAFMGAFNWINGFLLMYFALEVIQIRADQFWLTLSLMHASTFFFYFLRMKVLVRRAHSLKLISI